MKKRLEAELISIAHRILKLKNKSELIQLHQETQKLYEALSVLRFVEENATIIHPKIDVAFVEENLEKWLNQDQEVTKAETPILSENVFDQVNSETEPELKPDFEVEKEIKEELPSLNLDETFKPTFELEKVGEPELDSKASKSYSSEPVQISFEDLLGQKYSEPIFEKVITEKGKETDLVENKVLVDDKIEETKEVFEEPKAINTDRGSNSKIVSGIQFGLNDRIGFEKNLFDGSSEDMNRVISQLSTFHSLVEAKEFINNMVKPDYNYWKGKEDYEERFLEIVYNRFING